VTCPSVEELLAGGGADHALGCDDCRAVLELAATRVPQGCGLAEALLAAQAAGALRPESERLLAAHLAHCPSCALVAGSLDAPVMAEAFASAADLERNFDELAVIAPDNYVRGLEIGRGGMGHIVRARDRRLGRVVAIKQLLDARLKARFEREARLTARLQHPAIVTVYEAGRWPSGDPFYAMKYVAGRPLDLVIAELTTLDERLALLANLTTVADAIAYAHSEGIVHRDLKPQNILLGPFGETVVIDWGLAKDLHSASEPVAPFRDDGHALTQGGAGTPAYMAPEQARGEPPDERVDVYALGATLHHVLAGERPDLRPLPDATPRDLRTIVAKAMAAAPADRYPTAAEVAGELKRFQNGQLVTAHRYTTRELVRRWLARHRGITVVSALALAILVVTSALGVRRIVAERDRADQQKAIAEAHRMGAEQLVDYLVGTLQQRLEPVGRLELLAGVGKQVERYFASVPPASDTDVAVLRRRASALHGLGWVDLKQGNLEDARAEFERTRQLCERQDALAPTSDAEACAIAAIGQLANLDSYRGDTAAALARLREEDVRLDAALARYPADRHLRRLRGATRYYRAREHTKQGDYPGARAAFLEGIELDTALAAEDPRDTTTLNDLAGLQHDLCSLETEDGQPDRALAHCGRAAELRDRQLALEPSTVEWEVGRATATVGAADAALALGDAREAGDRLDAALDVLQRRVTTDPANRLWKSYLAQARWTACSIDLESAHLPQAVAACRDAAAGFEDLLRADPEREGAAVNLVGVESSLALGELAQHDLAAAHEAATRAVRRAEAWNRKLPGKFQWLVVLGEATWRAATVERAAGRTPEARAAAARSLTAIEGAASGPPTLDRELPRVRAELLVADLEGDAGERGPAQARLRRSLAGLERSIARWPKLVELQRQRAAATVRLAELASDPAEAHALVARAADLLAALEQRGALGLELRDLPQRLRRVAAR
jgi:tRNA A-37 threonylcarbamoyl transferase component Bud32/tetratricopeptide (TPR) repeat protein